MVIVHDRVYAYSILPAIIASILPVLETHQLVSLTGPMGAGKTAFVREVCAQLGVTDAVRSPSYVWVNQYQSPSGRVYHFDFYRVDNQPERIPAILDHCDFETCLTSGLCLVEWGGFLSDAAYAHHAIVHINLAYTQANDTRHIRVWRS